MIVKKKTAWLKGVLIKVKFFFTKMLSKMLWLGLLLAVWAVLSVELEWIPKIPCGLSETTVFGLNRAFLALAYSYIAGAVIYGMTVKYPIFRKKQRLTPVIQAKVKSIGVMLSNMNTEFRSNSNPPISDLEAVMALFSLERWKEPCILPEHASCKDVTEGFISDYCEFKLYVDSFISDYKEYLSTDQLIHLEAIRNTRLNQFFDTYERSGKQYQYSDAFYEKIFPPLYKDLILIYYGLAALSGVDVTKD